jgi:hypothetical protein
MTSRYQYINDVIDKHKPKTIVEVGTWKGDRAIQMAEAALRYGPIHYIGFDLFEDRTAETDDYEMCGTKKPVSLADVESRLRIFAQNKPGFTFDLHKGNTRQSLRAARMEIKAIDLAFIDGGHSVDTIRNDYEWLKRAKVVLFDDYFEPDDDGNCPDVVRLGCNTIVEDLDFGLMPAKDKVTGGGFTRMAIVPRDAAPDHRRLVVQTRNCVEPDWIKSNIQATMAREDLKFVRQAAAHDLTALMASGGPSLEAHFDRFRHRKPTETLVCVKHAHNRLIEAGIVPDICILLDPREKVGDFIANPHPKTLYLVASMCFPVVLDTLISKGARVMVYHARVGADEMEMLPGHILIQGGSTASTRGVSLLHAMGYRNFGLYAYDLCWDENPEPDRKDSKGKPFYFKVNVMERDFLTTAEKVAEAQDCERLMREQGLSIEAFGDGMANHIWRHVRRPSLNDVLEAA